MELAKNTHPLLKKIYNSIESIDHKRYNKNAHNQMKCCKDMIDFSHRELSYWERDFLKFVFENKSALLDEMSWDQK